MCGNYGNIAISAAERCRESGILPEDAWEQIEGRTDTESSCAAKCAFMRLCTDGHVRDIPPGNFHSQNDVNSDHGAGTIEALGYLVRRQVPVDKQRLYSAAESYIESPDSGELDVLIALWKNGDIAPHNPEQFHPD